MADVSLPVQISTMDAADVCMGSAGHPALRLRLCLEISLASLLEAMTQLQTAAAATLSAANVAPDTSPSADRPREWLSLCAAVPAASHADPPLALAHARFGAPPPLAAAAVQSVSQRPDAAAGSVAAACHAPWAGFPPEEAQARPPAAFTLKAAPVELGSSGPRAPPTLAAAPPLAAASALGGAVAVAAPSPAPPGLVGPGPPATAPSPGGASSTRPTSWPQELVSQMDAHPGFRDFFASELMTRLGSRLPTSRTSPLPATGPAPSPGGPATAPSAKLAIPTPGPTVAALAAAAVQRPAPSGAWPGVEQATAPAPCNGAATRRRNEPPSAASVPPHTARPPAAVAPAPRPSPATVDAGTGGAYGGAATSVTTYVLTKLPQRADRKAVLDLLTQHGFGGEFDFVYVPADFHTHAAKGYAFVNFKGAEIGQRFETVFTGMQLKFGDAPMVVRPAEIQGFRENVVRVVKQRQRKNIRQPANLPLVFVGKDSKGVPLSEDFLPAAFFAALGISRDSERAQPALGGNPASAAPVDLVLPQANIHKDFQ